MEQESLPKFYQLAFSRDEIGRVEGKLLRFSTVRAGTLHLPSGQIVACDPLVGQDRQPFVQIVLPGHYSVDISLGQELMGDVERIIFVRILFNKNQPFAWVKGMRVGGTEQPPEAENLFGLKLVSGAAAIMDSDTGELFQLPNIDDVDQILDALVANYRPERSWLNHKIDEHHNAIIFSIGKGARECKTYFAIDEDGDVCLALIRFSP